MENILTLTLTFKGCWRSMSKRKIKQNKNKNQFLEPVIIMSQLIAIFLSVTQCSCSQEGGGALCDKKNGCEID